MRLIADFKVDDQKKVEPKFKLETLKSIINTTEHKKLEFLVLSVVGARDGGKSFLISLMICFLSFLEKV